MSETTATHDYVWWGKDKIQTLKTPDGIVWVHIGGNRYRGVDALMKELQELKGETTSEIPTGWLCPRCGAVNAPDVKRCDCEPGVEDDRRGVPGPSEVK